MENKTRQEKIAKLRELIKEIDFAMLTTVNEDGSLISRPMSTQQAEFDGDLWFFTSAPTGKTEDIAREQQVNVAYAQPDKQRYISVSGMAVIVNDRAKMAELWSPVYKAYFPDGLDDPNLRLIKVSVHNAEYWESHGLIRSAIGFVQGLVEGEEADMGENERISLRH